MRNRNFLLKTLAIFLALNILIQVLAPTAAMALTSGPTTPEVSSFEPVDTTDMVNLSTGDFTYNIPLLDVPGPEGGYPLALSYHAGILPSQDASWVGLGWNLNPGSINRTVSNIPDDFNGYYLNPGAGAAQYSVTDQWNGGSTTTTSIGVGVSLFQVLSVGIDVGIKNDTYRGMGGSFGVSASAGLKNTQLSVGGGVGYDSWDGVYANANIGYGLGKGGSSPNRAGKLTAGLSVGISEAGGAYTSLGVSENVAQSSMGISLSSSGVNFSASVSGINMLKDQGSNSGKISTASSNFGFYVPIYMFYLSVGYKYSRYWMYEQYKTSLVGCLNGQGKGYTPYLDKNFDCTVLLNPNKSIVDQSDINSTINPTVATYDSYSVLGQGLSGSIEPAVLDNGSLYHRGANMKTDIYRTFTKIKHFFRFKNDFSNSHRITDAPGFSFNGNDFTYPTYPTNDLGYTLASMDPRGYKKLISPGYGITEARFAGSRHIEYFTNGEIRQETAKAAGFINTPNIDIGDRMWQTKLTNGYSRMPGTYDVTNNIGGYMITNEKGVTYHYALPAYTFGFEQQSSRYGPSGSLTQRNISNPAPYAYTWMLTAVTGPDYIDKNSNGLVDEEDFGYWVRFDYGKWHDRSGFRTPEMGENTDVDGSSVISSGFKEVYYLDAIKTRTHTALFIKDTRFDGKGTSSFDGKNFDSGIRELAERRAGDYAVYGDIGDLYVYQSYHKPITMMKLSEVLLIDNTTLTNFYTQNNLSTSSDMIAGALKSQNSFPALPNELNNTYVRHVPSQTYQYWSYTSFHNWTNVLNTTDFNPGQLEDLRSKSYKRFEFTYDYSLCPNTINSFDTDQNINLGKLTLKKVKCFGRNNIQLMPSTNFNYDLDNIADGSAAITWVPGAPGWDSNKRLGRIYTDMGSAPNLKEGDIVKFTANSKVYYISLIRLLPNANTWVREFDVLYLGKDSDKLVYPYNQIGNVSNGGAITVDVTQTKNPPYTPRFTDLWGSFKSDYKDIAGAMNNKAHQTTTASANGVDCWSLRSIETPAGANINVAYESDDYYNVALKNLPILNTIASGMQIKFTGSSTFMAPNVVNGYDYYMDGYAPNPAALPLSATEYIVKIDPKDLQYPLGDYVKVGDKVMMSKYSKFILKTGYTFEQPYYGSGTVNILEVDESTNSIRFSDPSNSIILAPISRILPGTTASVTCLYYWPGAGFITFPNRLKTPGGGIRTASVSVTDGATTHTTNYQYGQTTSNGIISWGSTAYEPSSMDDLIADPRFGSSSDNYMKAYKRSYYQTYESIFAIAQQLAAPGVIYENVKVKGSVTKSGVTTVSPTYESYRFQAFKKEMVEFVPNHPVPNVSGNNTIGNWTIADKTSGIGNLLSVRIYDKYDHLLSETSNTYTNNAPNDQGIIDQVYHEERRMNPDPNNGGGDEFRFGVQTIKSDFPSVLLSTTTRDFVKGFSSTTTNVAFDYYSGAVTETETKDSYGNTIQSISIPAYNWYAGMGLKLNNASNANMLSQTAANYVVRQTSIGNLYNATVTSTNNASAPAEVLVTLSSGLTLPMKYHEGSQVLGLTLPSYITWVSADRASFKLISRAPTLSNDLGSKTFSFTKGNVVNASINTWSNNWTDWTYNSSSFAETVVIGNDVATVQNDKVWRMQSDYAWNSPYLNADGTYKSSGTGIGSFVPFDYTASTQTSPYWACVNTNTRYSRNSKPLEAKDINNVYSSVKYCGNENYILGSSTGSKYQEFTHSGGEYAESTSGYSEGEVLGSAYRANYVSMYVHSGSYYFSIPTSSSIKYTASNASTATPVLKSSGAYRASVWVHKSSIANAQLYANVYTNGSLTSSPVAVCDASTIKCGDFYYLTLIFTGPGGYYTTNKIEVGVKNIGGSGTAYVDDFRFQPEVSSVTSYNYDKSTGMLTHVLDNDNRYTRYEYDSRYKLKAVYKETTNGEVKVSENQYNYARPVPD